MMPARFYRTLPLLGSRPVLTAPPMTTDRRDRGRRGRGRGMEASRG